MSLSLRLPEPGAGLDAPYRDASNQALLLYLVARPFF